MTKITGVRLINQTTVDQVEKESKLMYVIRASTILSIVA